LQWLTPATAALLLVFMVANQRGAHLLPLSDETAGPSLASAAFSNQFYAAYLPSGWHSYLNAWTRLGWTNDGALPSSISSFPRTGTNHLRW
jgi:hypothetical protein